MADAVIYTPTEEEVADLAYYLGGNVEGARTMLMFPGLLQGLAEAGRRDEVKRIEHRLEVCRKALRAVKAAQRAVKSVLHEMRWEPAPLERAPRVAVWEEVAARVDEAIATDEATLEALIRDGEEYANAVRAACP